MTCTLDNQVLQVGTSKYGFIFSYGSDERSILKACSVRDHRRCARLLHELQMFIVAMQRNLHEQKAVPELQEYGYDDQVHALALAL